MNILNLKKIKKQRKILISLAFLSLSTSQLAAKDFLDEEMSRSNSAPLVHQTKDSTLEEVKRSVTRPQYNLIGVALFSGNDLVSQAIKAHTHSDTSHIGLILSDVNDDDKWYSFEATGSAKKVLQGRLPKVRLKEWDKVVEKYNGHVQYRLLVFEGQERTDAARVTNFVDVYNGKPFTRNPLRLFWAAERSNPEPTSEPLKTVFCSELAAKMLIDMEILQSKTPGNFIPRDFADDTRLKLESGISLTGVFQEEKEDLKWRHRNKR